MIADKLIEKYKKENIELLIEQYRLCEQIKHMQSTIERLKAFVPHPSEMSGWDDQDCPDDVASVIREACEIHNIQVPEHLIETR